MAWTFVGVSASVQSASTAITLAEPAGVVDGDLLVACFASRSSATTAISNTGWTAVGSQNSNNVLTTTSALASGTMLYQIRAGAPDLSFVIPAGISVCLGRIVAYRGVVSATPLDASTAVTTAVNTTAVSVAGLTTTQADDLIVAMTAGGQEAAWSAFANVTTPLTASGATDTTTSPSPTAWIERADVQTTGGADTSLAIFDAVRTTTGATGALTATASVSAGHVVIAGAFKIAPTLPGPAFRSQSTTGYGARTDTVITAPAGIANDDILMLTIFVGHASAPPTPTLPAGFTLIDSTTLMQTGATFHANFRAAWKRAASESGSYTVTHTSASTQGFLAAYSGCIATGSPIDAYSKAFATDPTSVGATSTATSITTTVADTLLLLLEHNWTGSATLTPPTGFAERFDSLLYAADKAQAAAGATGAVSHGTGNPADEPWSAFLVALKPPASGVPGVKVWSGSAWVEKPAKVWTGSAWTQKPVKTWNGSAWT